MSKTGLAIAAAMAASTCLVVPANGAAFDGPVVAPVDGHSDSKACLVSAPPPDNFDDLLTPHDFWRCAAIGKVVAKPRAAKPARSQIQKVVLTIAKRKPIEAPPAKSIKKIKAQLRKAPDVAPPSAPAIPDKVSQAALCDQKAGNAFDPDLVTKTNAVDSLQLNATEGLAACKAALAVDPQNRRLIYNLGRAQEAAGDDGAAAASYQQAATLGSIAAMSNLGSLYERGDGVKQDYDKARSLYDQAASHGFAEAFDHLGDLYHRGRGVKTDDVMANGYYEQGAAAGYGPAITALGDAAYNGNGMAKDLVKARTTYETAAARGEPGALGDLGAMYENGIGGPADLTRARASYEQSVARGNLGAYFALGRFYKVQLRNPPLGRIYYEKAAAQGDQDGFDSLLKMYKNGEGGADHARYDLFMKASKGGVNSLYNLGVWYMQPGPAQDYGSALAYFQRAAGKGHVTATQMAGYIYDAGLTGRKDPAKAISYYKAAAAKGDIYSMTALGRLYRDGNGVDRDFAAARTWFEQGAAKGDADATTDLGELYYLGAGGAPNYVKARDYFDQAASKGFARAQVFMGQIYAQGQDVPVDINRARGYFQQAAAQGDATAKAWLSGHS